MDAGAHHRAALLDRLQRDRHERTYRREDDRCLQRLRGGHRGVACPHGAEFAGEILAILIPRAGERIDFAALVACDLGDDVGGRAEPVEAEMLGIPGAYQRPVADEPGAEERRRLEIGIAVGNREAVALVGNGSLGIAAVDRVAGEARALAEILPPARAEPAAAAGPAEPGDADALTLFEARDAGAQLTDRADDLVPRHERQLRLCQLAVDDVQIGATDAAGVDVEPNLAGPGLRIWQLELLERCPGPVEHHRPHAK